MASKKNKIKETTPHREVYRDFTMDEFDEFAFELQTQGAHYERMSIVEELERTAVKMKKLALMMPNDDAQTFEIYAAGITMAANIVAEMRSYEDNASCPECGAI